MDGSRQLRMQDLRAVEQVDGGRIGKQGHAVGAGGLEPMGVDLAAVAPVEVQNFHRESRRLDQDIDQCVHAKMVDLDLVRLDVSGTVLLDRGVGDEGLIGVGIGFHPRTGQQLDEVSQLCLRLPQEYSTANSPSDEL